MSDPVVSPSVEDSTTRSRRGQALVEFALLLPMLIVLLLGVADFARVFQAGIVTEAAARSGAEAAALERLRSKPPPSTDPNFNNYYQHLHDVAAQAACAETRILPNTTYAADDPLTSMPDDDVCASMPVIAACVLDGQDPFCGALASGFTNTPPAECSEITRTWNALSPGAVASHAVEVRICYRFTTLFNLNFSLPLGWGLSLGDVYLQRARAFVVDCQPGPDISGC